MTALQPPSAKIADAAPGSKITSLDRDVLTPEGIQIPVQIAGIGGRYAAALIDVSIILLISAGMWLLFAFISGWQHNAWFAAVGWVGFLIRVFYFPWFELHYGGRTPGKMAMGLRVIGRNGAMLDSRSIMARNLVREVEMWLPLTFVIGGAGGLGPLGYMATLGWIGCFLAFPLFNRERMRGGDMLAGTWVIEETKARLMPDALNEAEQARLARQWIRRRQGETDVTERLQFSPSQLTAYGAKELNTLGEVLLDRSTRAAERQKSVAQAIRKKIGFEGPAMDDTQFLQAYYTAARAQIEKEAQWGTLRKDKHDQRETKTGTGRG